MRLQSGRIVMIALSALLLTAMVASGIAWADNAALTESDTQQILFMPRTPEKEKLIQEREKDAQKLSNILRAVQRKQQPVDDYVNALKDFAAKWKKTNGDVGIQGIIASKVLGVQAVGQETTYYYGPASAVQLLLYKGFTSNPQDGRPTTQNKLANDLHTTSDGTPFPGYWETTMESWSWPAGWATVWAPTETQVWDDTKFDVDINWPLIYDTHMSSINGYLPGYTSGDIYHYVTGDGYEYDDQGNNYIHYVDPNRYRDYAFGPHWTTLNQMWKVVRDRGIVW